MPYPPSGFLGRYPGVVKHFGGLAPRDLAVGPESAVVVSGDQAASQASLDVHIEWAPHGHVAERGKYGNGWEPLLAQNDYLAELAAGQVIVGLEGAVLVAGNRTVGAVSHRFDVPVGPEIGCHIGEVGAVG